jgi:type IV secretory pathway VirB3-like protein
MANGTIDSDPLFGGLTRPPVFLGVPQFYFVLNILLLKFGYFFILKCILILSGYIDGSQRK